MHEESILLLKGDEIAALFDGREQEIVNGVNQAYRIHGRGDSCLPHSSFVRFPNKEKERIIALPGFLGGDYDIAGMKWIASFPGNLAHGRERASAVLVLNSTVSGYPLAMMESSVISAKRTAASAALAGKVLQPEPVHSVGLIGCGLINFETLRFLLAVRPEIRTVAVYDLQLERAEAFVNKAASLSSDVAFKVVEQPHQAQSGHQIVALATTAVTPHMNDLNVFDRGTVVLHTSLRDFMPDAILAADNIVDDHDHVLRAKTSVHLAEEQCGHRKFIRASLAQVLEGEAPPRSPDPRVTIFSPFGLGVLDLALAKLVYQLARAENRGTSIDGFLPTHWLNR